MERMTGIEPALSAWEADVLPLNYIRRLVRFPAMGGPTVLAQHTLPEERAWLEHSSTIMVRRVGSAPSWPGSARADAALERVIDALQGGQEYPPGIRRTAQQGTRRVPGVAQHDLAGPRGRFNAVPVGDAIAGFSPRYVTIITCT
jgi:hypothetical protein